MATLRRLESLKCTNNSRQHVQHIEDFSECLQRKTIFSTLDLIKTYYQISAAEKDIPKIAINTPFGMYEFVNMSFGLRNTA